MAIQGYAEGIEMDVVDPQNAAGIIMQETERMTGLVEEILSISKIDSRHFKLDLVKLDIKEVLYDCFRSLDAVQQMNGISIVTEFPDEEIYVKQLTEYIRKYQTERGRSIKGTVFGDGEDITENYSGGFDIILMDIQMQFMDGMTAAEKIRQMDQKVIIMFITNMIQYAVRGYEVDAMDYVVKPVEYFSFSQKLDKAIGRIRSEAKEFLMITIGEGIVKTDIADIYFIEGQRHNVIYYTSRGDYCSRITMKELEEKLAVHNFFRCAKGYLVNMNHVEGFVGSDCVIHNVHIPDSRTRKKEFMNLLLQNLNME